MSEHETKFDIYKSYASLGAGAVGGFGGCSTVVVVVVVVVVVAQFVSSLSRKSSLVKHRKKTSTKGRIVTVGESLDELVVDSDSVGVC